MTRPTWFDKHADQRVDQAPQPSLSQHSPELVPSPYGTDEVLVDASEFIIQRPQLPGEGKQIITSIRRSWTAGRESRIIPATTEEGTDLRGGRRM